MAKNEFLNMTPEQRRENGRKGGIASGEAKRKKKAMRERLEILLAMPLGKGEAIDIEDIQSFAALKKKNITVQEAVLVAQITRAMTGDTAAAAFVRDTVGEKPKDNMNVGLQLPVFYEGEDELED